MTDEEKKVTEAKECRCGELGRFFTLVAAIFIGTLLAILVSAALLRPQCPCHKRMPMPMGGPGIEQQMPPMPGQWQVKHPEFGHKFRHHNHGFRPDKKFDKAPADKD